jgi:hypothetical protein
MAGDSRSLLDFALAGRPRMPRESTETGQPPRWPYPGRSPVRMMLLLATIGSFGCAAAPRLVDSNSVTGFALYRSGQLSGAELTQLCGQGVEELLVLDGGAINRECRMLREQCPGLRVRYNFAQNEKQPVSQEFLGAFDQWIEEGKAEGRKLAYRCRRGWHRAGRLTAYYQIRFMGASVQEAIDEMQARGRFMWWYPRLDPQVEALGEWVARETCSGGAEFCPQHVDPTSEGLQADGSFPLDACSGQSGSEVAR